MSAGFPLADAQGLSTGGLHNDIPDEQDEQPGTAHSATSFSGATAPEPAPEAKPEETTPHG